MSERVFTDTTEALQYLDAYRRENRTSLTWLSETTEIDATTIRAWLRGSRQPTAFDVQCIADVLSHDFSLRLSFGGAVLADTTVNRVIAQAFSDLRQASGLPQEAAAQHAGCCQASLAQFETSKRVLPFSQLRDLAHALGATIVVVLREKSTRVHNNISHAA